MLRVFKRACRLEYGTAVRLYLNLYLYLYLKTPLLRSGESILRLAKFNLSLYMNLMAFFATPFNMTLFRAAR